MGRLEWIAYRQVTGGDSGGCTPGSRAVEQWSSRGMGGGHMVTWKGEHTVVPRRMQAHGGSGGRASDRIGMYY